MLSSFGKDRPAPVSIPHIFISSIQNNPPTHSPLPSLSYKSPFPLPTLESKKSIVEIYKIDNISSNIEI